MTDVNRQDLKVLIIDDEPDLIEILKGILEGLGFEQIITASDGEEGFFKAFESQPDLIFLDLIMPGMDGVKALDVLDQDDRTAGIPVIINSSLLSEKDVEEKGGELHGRLCISKPYQIPQIEAAISRALG
jgi:CheY-like chemotaxis protein